MDIYKLNELIIEAKPLLKSGISVIKNMPNGEEEITQCTFTSYTEGGVGPIKEVGEHTSKEEMSYFPKAILTVKTTNEIIDKFPLKIVVDSIKRGEPINDDFFKQTKKTPDFRRG